MKKYLSKEKWSYLLYTMNHPIDGFYWIRHRDRGSVPIAVIMVILFSLSFSLNRINANFIVKEVKDALMVPDAVFDFRPSPDMIDEKHRKSRPKPPPVEVAAEDEAAAPAEQAEPGERALVWRKVGDKTVAPVRVRKLDTDGTRTIVVPAEGETLNPGMELVTGVLAVSSDDEAAPHL